MYLTTLVTDGATCAGPWGPGRIVLAPRPHGPGGRYTHAVLYAGGPGGRCFQFASGEAMLCATASRWFVRALFGAVPVVFEPAPDGSITLRVGYRRGD